jgi:type IV fimbrial biogenesis protein FimT
MTDSRTRGFTLIELMIGLAIAALLLVLAMPGYSLWIADNQIRNAAESIAGGLRYAQGEAIKQNSQVEFVLDPTTGKGGWLVRLVSDGSTLQSGVFAEGADRTTLTPLPAATTTVTFTGLGSIAAINADASGPLTQVQVTSASGVAGARDLNVLVGGNRTGVKICDPKWPATDPKGCP